MAFEIAVVIQIISILILTLEGIYVFLNMRTKGQEYLFLFCFAAMINNTCYLFEMFCHTSQESFLTSRLCYIGKVWIPLAFFAMIMELCEHKIPKKIYAVMVFIHASVLGLVLTSDQHQLFYTSRIYVEEGLFPHNVMGHSVIYNAYMILLMGYTFYGTIALIRKYAADHDKNMRRLYRNLLFAIATMILGLILYMAKVTFGYDPTNFGYAVTAVVLLIAIIRFRLMDNLTMAKDYVIDTISEGVIAVDRDNHVVYYNRSAGQIYDNLEADQEKIVASIRKSVDTGEVLHIGERIYEAVVKDLYLGKNLNGSLYVLDDVTVRYKHMEELQEQKDIAEAANASKSAFLSIVTHEIRTPLSSVVGMTELILREPENLTEKQEKYLRNIKNSGESLVMIVNDILDQSKIEAGKMEIVEDAYELIPLIEDVKMIIENRIGSKPIHLLYEVEEDIPRYLFGDSLRIRQILINLMNNAVKFTEEGYIKLSVTCMDTDRSRRRLRFSVKDSGQGIRKEDLSKLGQAFTQVDTKKNHQKIGTGLGLSISKDFIAMMGGQLRVTSEYGKGSEFYFSIWQGMASGIDVPSGAGLKKQAWQEEEQFTAPDARILVVDDTELNLLMISELLQPLDMQVETANSGEKAIEMILQNRYDLIFMDYMMPYMNGVETTEKIRQEALKHGDDDSLREYYKSVPIIALSGDDSNETMDRFFRAGIDDFTVKPVELKRLKKMLIKWLPKEKIRSK